MLTPVRRGPKGQRASLTRSDTPVAYQSARKFSGFSPGAADCSPGLKEEEKIERKESERATSEGKKKQTKKGGGDTGKDRAGSLLFVYTFDRFATKSAHGGASRELISRAEFPLVEALRLRGRVGI